MLSGQLHMNSHILAVQGIVCEAFFFRVSYDIKVDFCQMFLFAVLMSQITRDLDTMTSNVS